MKIQDNGGYPILGKYLNLNVLCNHIQSSGANVPALNELLEHFGIEFGDFVGEGEFRKCY